MSSGRAAGIGTPALSVGPTLESGRARVRQRALVNTQTAERVAVLIPGTPPAAIGLPAGVRNIVAGLGRNAVVVGVTAGFANTVAGVAPLAGIAGFGRAARGYAVIIQANLPGQRTVDVVDALLDAVSVHTAREIGIFGAIGVREAVTGAFRHTSSEVAIEPDAAVIVALANRGRGGAFAVLANEADRPGAVFASSAA